MDEEQAAFADRLVDFATDLTREQHWYDGVRKLWGDLLEKGEKGEERSRATKLRARVNAIRKDRANELRTAAEEAPQSIAAELYKLAIRLETSGDDVSDSLCDLAASISPSAPLHAKFSADILMTMLDIGATPTFPKKMKEIEKCLAGSGSRRPSWDELRSLSYYESGKSGVYLTPAGEERARQCDAEL